MQDHQIQQQLRPRRVLLSTVPNAFPGNSIALSSDHHHHHDDNQENAIPSTSGRTTLGLYRCGVSGCRCEHFTVSDVNKAATQGYGVCTHCSHGAMYHSSSMMTMQKKNNTTVKQQHKQHLLNNNNNSGATSLTASAAQSVSPLPQPLMSAAQQQQHQTTSASQSFPLSVATPFSSTRTSLGGTHGQQQQFSSAARMNLTSILSLVDNLERSAVLKTMKCEETASVATRTAKCSLLSQALTLLVRACDVINERISFLKKLVEHNDNNSNFSPETCLNEKSTLTRRLDQLTQHCEKVRSMLCAAENHQSDGTVNNNNRNVFLLDQPSMMNNNTHGNSHNHSSNSNNNNNSFQNNSNSNYYSSASAVHHNENMLMMRGPVEHCGDEDDNHREDSPSTSSHFFSTNANNQIENSNYRSGSAFFNQHHQNHQNVFTLTNTTGVGGASRSTSDQQHHQLVKNSLSRSVSQESTSHHHDHQSTSNKKNLVRLCKECLETTLVTSLFCHNCGKASTSSVAQIRAPSPDPTY